MRRPTDRLFALILMARIWVAVSGRRHGEGTDHGRNRTFCDKENWFNTYRDGVPDDRMYGAVAESAIGRERSTDSYRRRCVRVPYDLCRIVVCEGESAMPCGIRRLVARRRRVYGTDKPVFEKAIRDAGGIDGFAGTRSA